MEIFKKWKLALISQRKKSGNENSERSNSKLHYSDRGRKEEIKLFAHPQYHAVQWFLSYNTKTDNLSRYVHILCTPCNDCVKKVSGWLKGQRSSYRAYGLGSCSGHGCRPALSRVIFCVQRSCNVSIPSPRSSTKYLDQLFGVNTEQDKRSNPW
jgi:hypothetical protein